MPILVKDYEWSETKEKVHITVPLKGVKASNVDLLSTDEFLKANFPPFLFEILLHEKIIDDDSVAKIRDGRIDFNLTKQEPEMWGKLVSEKSMDKAFMLQKKLEAVKYVQTKLEEKSKEKEAEKNLNKKYALKEMMKLEEQERSRIDTEKESERKKAAEDMEKWKAMRQQEEEIERKRLIELQIDDSINRNDFDDDSRSGNVTKDVKKIFKDDDVVVKAVTNGNSKQKDEHLPKPRTSKPREGGKINFKFTPRVFPTPLRESKTEEEEAWLRKQAEARKTTEVDDPDLEEHEKDPIWLKDKGNKLFASGNFLAAVNAYNLAIRMQPKMHILYMNRSACHLKLHNFYKCIEDCSTALDLLQPPVPANATARLKAHVRKGTAFCGLELYAEGLQDYMAAMKIDPNNEQLQKDSQRIRDIIEKGDTVS